jgi:hypothetical protein
MGSDTNKPHTPPDFRGHPQPMNTQTESDHDEISDELRSYARSHMKLGAKSRAIADAVAHLLRTRFKASEDEIRLCEMIAWAGMDWEAECRRVEGR